MNCSIKVDRQSTVPLIQIAGKLIRKDVRRLMDLIQELSKQPCEKIVIDMNGTAFIDSYGIGALIFSWQVCKDQNCELVIVTSQPLLRTLFKSTHLDQAFKVMETLE
jgi:anti-anti-sigma factor